MKSYDVSYFCEKDAGPIVHIHVDKKNFSNNKWPFTLVINSHTSPITNPRIIFYIDSIEDLIAFKTSVIFQIEKIQFELDKKEESSNG